MIFWWLWIWMAFVAIFLLAPLIYGWGYRGWGPPYPRFHRRRAGAATATTAELEGRPPQESGWGGIADALWLGLLIALVWLLAALLW